jgi:hypothetical protein
MDWMSSLVRLVDALAWPVTVLVGIGLLRGPLARLIPETRRVKYKDFEAEFGRQVHELRESAAAEHAKTKPSRGDDRARRLRELASIAPNASVLEAWRDVETAAKALLAAHDYDLDYDVDTPYRMIEGVLGRDDLVPTRQVKMYRELRRLRNKVAHADDYDLSPGQAREYIDLAMALCEELEERTAAATEACADDGAA